LSSILKALKKIEGRKVDKGLPAWPYGTGRLESMDSHIRRSRQRQKILGFLIALCVVALAGKLYFGSRPDVDNVTSRSGEVPETTLEKEPVQASQPESRTNVVPTPRSVPATTLESSPRDTSSETTPPSVISPATEEEASPENAAPVVISPYPVEPGEFESPAAAVKETPVVATTETFATPPTDNAGLSLMALVWSPQKGSRFVVINGDIVREGGSIEDSTVVRIEEDYAVVRTGGITWKLK